MLGRLHLGDRNGRRIERSGFSGRGGRARDPERRKPSARAVKASHRVVALINRAVNEREAEGAPLIRLKLPPLAATIASELPSVRNSVLAVDLQTTAGQTCRVAVLRTVAMTQWVYASIAREAAAGRPAAKVVFDLINGLNRVNRTFEADLKPCLAGLQPDERPVVKYILGA